MPSPQQGGVQPFVVVQSNKGVCYLHCHCLVRCATGTTQSPGVNFLFLLLCMYIFFFFIVFGPVV